MNEASATAEGLQRLRDSVQLGAPSADKSLAAVALVDAARRGSARFRQHARGFLHAKVYLVDRADDALVVLHGSANLTNGGVRGNWEQIQADDTPQARNSHAAQLRA